MISRYTGTKIGQTYILNDWYKATLIGVNIVNNLGVKNEYNNIID